MRRNFVPTVAGVSEEVKLSQKERETIQLLFRGLGYKQIAVRMNLTESSLSSRVYNLTQALRVSGKQGLMCWGAKYPRAIEGDNWVVVATHPAECSCGSPYCNGVKVA